MANHGYILDGSFSLEFDGQSTGLLEYDATAEVMETALEHLCTISDVQVSRYINCSVDDASDCEYPQSFTWLVTFVSLPYPGDQHNRYGSSLQERKGHKLNIDNNFLWECTDLSRSSCEQLGKTGASVGSIIETQRFVVESSPFNVIFGGKSSAMVFPTDSLADLETKLEQMETTGDVSLMCDSCVGNILAAGKEVDITFNSLRGDVPLLKFSDPSTIISEIQKGTPQPVIGRSSYSKVLTGMSSLKYWCIRVFAYNNIGSGRAALAIPQGIRTYVRQPSVPKNVSLDAHDSTSLVLSWNPPISTGGSSIVDFIVELDTSPAFTSNKENPLLSYAVSVGDADTSAAIVTSAYSNNPDVRLRKKIIISNSSLIQSGIISIGTELLIEGQYLSVEAIDENGCGGDCLTLDSDYTGSSTGAKIYVGPDAKMFKHIAHNLIPGVEYFARVRARALLDGTEGPASFPGYPSKPLSLAPISSPDTIARAVLSTVSPTALRVDYDIPENDRPEGNNGSPITNYHIELASRINEVQSFTLSSNSSFISGSFRLALATESTRCIDVGASEYMFELLLEELPSVDGVQVKYSPHSNISKHEYEIIFDGPILSNGNQNALAFDQSDCRAIDPDTYDAVVKTRTEGSSGFLPEVFSIEATSEDLIRGYIEVSVDFLGEYNQLVSIGSDLAWVQVEAGSKHVDTLGVDLSTIILEREKLMIGSELVQVEVINVDSVTLTNYHIHGTDGASVNLYRMDNYVGFGTLSKDEMKISGLNGVSLSTFVGNADLIKTTSKNGEDSFYEIDEISGSEISITNL